MGVLFRTLLIGAACVAGSCRTPETRFTSQEELHRDLVARYPPGSTWREPQDKLGTFELWQIGEPAPDAFAEIALARSRTESEDVRGCWWGFVARQTLGTSFGAMGSFVDYVFVDSGDRVIVAYRRFFD